MCGIAGFYSLDNRSIDIAKFTRVMETIRHRGPDDYGYAAFNSKTGAALFLEDASSMRNHDFSPDLIFGHRRLSIIDLSPLGRQPMTDQHKSLWIVYNGEIYNYIELRNELMSLGRSFSTHSDTEVILQAYAQWGEDCLDRFNGMFAFAIWDVNARKLFCARDRLGVKPFYYYYNGSHFAFASEIKALLEVVDDRGPNYQIIYDYLSQGFIDHTEETFFDGIKQLGPANSLAITSAGMKIRKWWDLTGAGLTGLSDEEYSEGFFALFQDSVRIRLRSDVPIGTCLSGGLDSSSIVSVVNRFLQQGRLAPAIFGDRQRTFSSCFDDRTYDERPFIEDVVRQTGVRSYYTFPDGNKLFDIIPKIIWHQDEPFGSTSIYAQWHVMKLAKESGVTVLLDGQGADELLAGYHGYFGAYYLDLLKKLNIIGLITEIFYYRRHHGHFQPMILSSIARSMLSAHCISAIRKAPVIRSAFKQVSVGTAWINRDFENAYNREQTFPDRFNNRLSNQLYAFLVSLSLPALLHYEDRNSMAFSLEARVPFLDYRLVEYAFSLPSSQKLRSGITKFVLRNAMRGVLPESVRKRKDKMGFVTPENVWFRTLLRDKITELIESKEFGELGLFDIVQVRKEFERHCRGEKDIGFTIWRWINLLLWWKMFMRKERPLS